MLDRILFGFRGSILQAQRNAFPLDEGGERNQDTLEDECTERHCGTM